VDEERIILCTNVDHLGNATAIHCHRCGADIVASPASMEMIEAGAEAICFGCAPPIDEVDEVRVLPKGLDEMREHMSDPEGFVAYVNRMLKRGRN